MATDPHGGKRFEGKRAIVTGGADGIGRAIAEGLLAESARVAIADVNRVSLSKTEAELDAEHPDRVLTMPCDVSNAEDVDRFVSEAVRGMGGVDVLVNNAAVVSCARLTELSESEWDRVLDINAKGVFLFCRRVVPEMAAGGGGSVVSLASQGAEELISHYCAAKAAVISLSRALAREVAPDVRVNCVCPGVVETEMMRSDMAARSEALGEDVDVLIDSFRRATPLGRFQRAEDVAAAVLFMASDDAKEITGQTLSVDGGLVMS